MHLLLFDLLHRFPANRKLCQQNIGDNNFCHCVTQLKLWTLDKLSSTIFCCLWVSLWGIGVTQPNLHFFYYIQAQKPFTVLIPVPTYTGPKYQPVSSYTDPVPSSTTYNSSSRNENNNVMFIKRDNLIIDGYADPRQLWIPC